MQDGPEQQHTLVAGDRLASYVITRVLGQGGMGIVYEAVHEALGKRVAIKTLLATGAHVPELTARFVREGKAVARIRHPNVIDVADVGVQGGMPYLVMEYLEGEDLAALLEKSAPMRASEIADLMVPIASALAAAHTAGIVHRDLKPENVFITRGPGGVKQPKLLDFGISKLSDAQAMSLTGTHAILGTPFYMSPEQAGGARDVDHRSDVFSLGVMLYQCATRELPFFGESLFQLLGAIMHSTPPTVRSLASGVPVQLEAVIEKAMRKDPAQRYQSALELCAALLPLASQRVRLAYQDELGQAGFAASERPAADALASTAHAEGAAFASARMPTPPPVTREAPAIADRRPKPIVIAGALVVLAAAAFAIWSRSEEKALQAAPIVAPEPAAEVQPPSTSPLPVHAAARAHVSSATTDRDAGAEPSTEAAGAQHVRNQEPAPAPAPEPAVERVEQSREHAPARDRVARERPSPRVRASSQAKAAKPHASQPAAAASPAASPATSPPAVTPARPAPVSVEDLFRDRK